MIQAGPEFKVLGKNSLDAVQDLNAANLKARVVPVPSDQPAGSVIAPFTNDDEGSARLSTMCATSSGSP